MKKVLDSATIQLMNIFESTSGVGVKDCVMSPQLIVFVVKAGDIGKAVGKGGQNVRKLERVIKKKVKVVEHSEDMLSFVKNVISPLELSDIEEDEGTVVMRPKDLKTRGMLIGRNASHLRFYESLVQRFFPLKELKVK